MNASSQIHDLLPWFATGKLRQEDADAFRDHLDGCQTCREDLDWVTKMKQRLDEHGAALLEEHPDADKLVAAVSGELVPEETARVRRHLALCATCELEARWVTGDAVVETGGPSTLAAPSFWSRNAGLGWGLAAAAVLTLGLVLPSILGPAEDAGGLFRPAVLQPVLRADEPQNAFRLGTTDRGLQLVLTADFPAEAFPIELQILDASGGAVMTRQGVTRDYLVEGATLIWPCPSSICSPGTYTARLIGAGDGGVIDYRFEVTTDGL